MEVEISLCTVHESLAARLTELVPAAGVVACAKACPTCVVTLTASGLCEWFALCRNPATTVRPHSLLGAVPICSRCDAKVGRLEGEPVRTCRVCGCTDELACEGGCAWAGADLCSRCAGLGYVPGEVPDAVEG